MTYEEFKKELFRNVSEQETNEHKQVKLITKGSEGPIREEHNVIAYLQPAEDMQTTDRVQEDYLYVRWGKGNSINQNSWKIRKLYEVYKREGWQSVLPVVLEHSAVKKGEGSLKQDRKKRQRKDGDRMILRLINYENYRELLTDCVCWRFGDMALVLCTYLEDTDQIMSIESGFMNGIPMDRMSMEKIEAELTELLTGALLNSCIKMPPRLFLAEDIRFQYDWSDGIFMPDGQAKGICLNPQANGEGIKGYRLTTAVMKNGALAIFYPGVMERLAELMKEDYYVGFTSIHEAVLHPVSCKNPNEMLAAIKHVNAVYDRRDMLSDKVYRYWSKQRKLLEIQ